MSTDGLANIVGELLTKMMQAKEHQVHQHHDKRDLYPLAIISGGGEDSSFQIPLVNTCTQHEHQMYEVLGSALDQFVENHGKPKLLMVAAEGYCMTIPESEFEGIERGQMQKDFETNPGSQVSEALIVTGAEDDLVGGCNVVQLVQPYGYDDGLQVIWREQQKFTYEAHELHEWGGEMAKTIQEAFSHE